MFLVKKNVFMVEFSGEKTGKEIFIEVLFSAGWGTKEAENVFLTHIWESGC